MAIIQLTKGHVTVVDDNLFEQLNKYKWFAVETVTGPNGFHICAARWLPLMSEKRICLRMHNEIYGQVAPGNIVDHEDRDSLNNRKYNLREVSRSINAYNSERSINASGVYYDKNRDRFKAFKLKPVKKYMGTFLTRKEAEDALK